EKTVMKFSWGDVFLGEMRLDGCWYGNAPPNTRLERTRHKRASLLSRMGEPLKRNVRWLSSLPLGIIGAEDKDEIQSGPKRIGRRIECFMSWSARMLVARSHGR